MKVEEHVYSKMYFGFCQFTKNRGIGAKIGPTKMSFVFFTRQTELKNSLSFLESSHLLCLIGPNINPHILFKAVCYVLLFRMNIPPWT